MAGTTSAKRSRRASEDGRATSFLKSTTGILTAIATLVAAVAGLLTALTQFRGDDSPPPVATPAPAPSPPAAATTVVVESDAQRELRSHIPDSIWPTCGPPVDEEEGSVAAFNCRHREIVGIQYNLFASATDLEAAYNAVKRRYGLTGASPDGSCEAGDFEGPYRSDGQVVGDVLCFVDREGHVAAIVWTHERLDTLSFAWRDDQNLAALFESWQNGFGPEE
jgi:hypothetical protein